MIKPDYSPKHWFVLTVLLAFTTIANAQTFGGNPPSVKWNQVNTPEVKVIFPAGMDSAGRRVADVIHRMNSKIQPTIGFKQKQISVVLQNQNTISNAYVGLAPFRSEFYLTPDQNSFEIGSLPWVDQLAIHEYRHVQQYNNFNVGAAKTLSTVFGQSAQALANALAVPDWFFEGDAVYNETLVSTQGRGRIPYFFNGYRGLWAAGKNYSYMKLRNGSYRDYVPNHYPLGYMLVSYGREKFGNEFWKNVTFDAASFNTGIYPFQKAVKKYANEDFTKFEQDALKSFRKEFNDQPEVNAYKNKHFIADEEYPAYVNDDAIIYVKTTYKDRSAFVMKTGNTERQISIRDLSLDNYFDYNNGKIIYAAYNTDSRWGYRTYNELVIVDVATGAEHRITRKTRYFSPSFSADGKTIVAVQVDLSGKSELHLLDTVSGKLIKVIANPNQIFYTYPKFYNDEKLVSTIRNRDGTMDIALIAVNDGKVEPQLYGAVTGPIGFPVVKKDTIFFTASSGYNDELFAIQNGSLFRLDHHLLRHTIGNYQPTVSAHNLAWASFTAYGYQLNQVNKSDIKWTAMPARVTFSSALNIATPLDSAANILAKVTNEALPVTSYSKAHGLFNFHSLIPEFADPNYTISLEGQNVLNTFQSNLLFNYNKDEGYKQFGFGAVYGALFPYLTGSVNYTLDRKGFYSKTNTNIYWNEVEGRVGARVPLTFINGTHVTGFSFGTDAVYNNTSFQSAYRSTFADRSYTYLNNSITFSNRIAQPKQNIFPRFAQSLTLNYKSAISGITAEQFLASGALYLPGLSTNHNLVITSAFQQKNRNSVISFSNNFPFSRGYTAENLYQLQKVGVNYHFPISYPDKGIANTVYFNRIRGNLYFDYTHANDFYTNGANFKADFRTAGAEVYFDTRWFNQTAITFGIRYCHLFDRDFFSNNRETDRIELIVPLTIF